MSLLEELKRRSVFKVTVAYGLVAWLVAQLAEFATSTFGAPDWALRTFVVLLLLGFPVAITLAWAFDLTPSGLKKASGENVTTSVSTGTNVMVMLLLGVVLAAAVTLQFWGPDISSSRRPKETLTTDPDFRLHADIVFPRATPLAFVGAAALGNGRRAFTISPDGRHLVFSGVNAGRFALYIRDLDSHEVRKLDGTENGYDPFFSPNGQWIAFFSGNQLKRVATAGGNAVDVTEATNSVGGTWIGNDQILAFTDEGDTWLQYAFGGDRIETDIPGFGGDAPYAIPGSHRVIWNSHKIVVFDTVNETLQALPFSGNDPRYLDGFLFFTQGDTLMAARFDPVSMELGSSPVPVLTGVRTEVYGFSQWALAQNGTLLYATGISAAENRLILTDGKQVQDLQLPRREKGSFEISPDGNKLLVAESQSGSTDLWLYDLKQGVSRRLTTETGVASSWMNWLPDSKTILYHRRSESGRVPYLLSLDSGVPGKPLFDETVVDLAVYSISADGRYLAVRGRRKAADASGTNSTADDMMVIDRVEDSETIIPMVDNDSWGMAVSPDGRAVVYTSSVSGEYQNYLQPVPPTGKRYQVSRVGGAEEPRWSRDGSKIYYRSGLRIMVVDVQTSPEIVLSEPRVFYEGNFVNVGGRSYDISPDGTRALVIEGPEDTTGSIRLINDWMKEVERIVAASESH